MRKRPLVFAAIGLLAVIFLMRNVSERSLRVNVAINELSAMKWASTPVADVFDQPMGSERAALTYNAQPFWAMNDARGGHHTGDDLNGIGGMNTDLGDAVYAAADGLVVYVGVPSEGWGKVVIMAHRLSDGSMVHSMYAHLLESFVKENEIIGRGQKIAEVGTANGTYPAHLHYEIRKTNAVDLGRGYADLPLNRVSPEEFIKLHASKSTELTNSVWAVLNREK